MYQQARKGLDGEVEWYGPKVMSEELYVFADHYYYSVGSKRTFKAAAIACGKSETSAAALGSKYARYTVVINYWKSLDETIQAERKRIHMRALRRSEEISANSKEITDDLLKRVSINNDILDRTASVFEVVKALEDLDNQEGMDGSTEVSVRQVLDSMQSLIWGAVKESTADKKDEE